MAEFYKLLFDLSFYYALTGCFLRLIGHVTPSAAGFVALCLVPAADAALRAKSVNYARLRYVPILLPLLALLLRPGLVPFLHMLPVWAYLGWSILTDRVSMRHDEFQSHFGFVLKLLFLLIFIPMFPGERVAAALQTVPYLVLMLVVGVCMLRMLREDRVMGLWHGIYMGVFVLLCAGLTLGRAPQLLLKGIGLMYRSVFAPLIFFLAVILAVVFYGFYLLMKWLVSLRSGEAEAPRIDLQGAADMLGLGDEYAAYTANLDWLRILLIVIGCALLALILFLIFRRMLGERAGQPGANPFSERRAALHGPGKRAAAPGRIRPREPRLAVRYYYARFLAECRRRGLELRDGMTAEELCAASAPLFPGADPAALTEVYVPARYNLAAPVTQAEVRRAAAAWNALRHSEAPEALTAKKHKPKNKS